MKTGMADLTIRDGVWYNRKGDGMKNYRQKLRALFPFSWRDFGICFLLISLAALVCMLLQISYQGEQYATMLFTFAVFLTARFTEGYLFGAIAALFSVIYVNFAFTYPYYAFNFTITGYPLTFSIMLAVSLITSALTTQVKRQQNAWLEAQKETVRANLLRAVSHDLRTPLTSIAGAVSVVLENADALDPEQETRLLTNARNDAQWLIRMVENLLSVTRLGQENAQIVKSDELIEEVVGEAVQKFRNRFPASPLRVSVPQEPVLVPMDPILVEQVLTNLLENTATHAPDATQVSLCVTITQDTALFIIDDNGPGLTGDPAALFDGSGTGSGERRGCAGIGLSVCKTIIAAHGGTISARNRLQGGAEFRFTLPLGQ